LSRWHIKLAHLTLTDWTLNLVHRGITESKPLLPIMYYIKTGKCFFVNSQAVPFAEREVVYTCRRLWTFCVTCEAVKFLLLKFELDTLSFILLILDAYRHDDPVQNPENASEHFQFQLEWLWINPNFGISGRPVYINMCLHRRPPWRRWGEQPAEFFSVCVCCTVTQCSRLAGTPGSCQNPGSAPEVLHQTSVQPA